MFEPRNLGGLDEHVSTTPPKLYIYNRKDVIDQYNQTKVVRWVWSLHAIPHCAIHSWAQFKG